MTQSSPVRDLGVFFKYPFDFNYLTLGRHCRTVTPIRLLTGASGRWSWIATGGAYARPGQLFAKPLRAFATGSPIGGLSGRIRHLDVRCLRWPLFPHAIELRAS